MTHNANDREPRCRRRLWLT